MRWWQAWWHPAWAIAVVCLLTGADLALFGVWWSHDGDPSLPVPSITPFDRVWCRPTRWPSTPPPGRIYVKDLLVSAPCAVVYANTGRLKDLVHMTPPKDLPDFGYICW